MEVFNGLRETVAMKLYFLVYGGRYMTTSMNLLSRMMYGRLMDPGIRSKSMYMMVLNKLF